MSAGSAPGRARYRLWLRSVRHRVRDRDFWLVQLGVLVVALLHVLLELTGLPRQHTVGAVVYVPPLLLLAPVAWAGLRYGLEGGVLTALWAAGLTVPNLVLWHPDAYEWLGDLLFLALVLGLGVLIAVPVERERAARRHAAETTERLHAVEQEQLRTYVHEVTLAQEAERTRIARELHDDVAQHLIVLVRHLDLLTADHDPERLTTARDVASRALAEVRRTSRDLRPTVLDDLGLSPALQWLAEDLSSRSDVRATSAIEGRPRRLAAPVELALFRIAQEALRNVERHAAADSARLTLTFAAEETRVEVVDDGRGFEVPDRLDALARSGRLGTIGMRERAELVGGTFRLDAAPGRGTTVEAVVPITAVSLPHGASQTSPLT